MVCNDIVTLQMEKIYLDHLLLWFKSKIEWAHWFGPVVETIYNKKTANQSENQSETR